MSEDVITPDEANQSKVGNNSRADEDAQLATMGHKAELNRNFSTLYVQRSERGYYSKRY
jgi:hypothetical protein